jgi:ATP-dependent Clp protease protease subunit
MKRNPFAGVSPADFACLAVNGPVVPFKARKANTRIEVKAKGETEAEVWLYGDIGEDWFGEGNTAKGLAAELKALGAVKTLNVYINSPGGSVFEGVAIYNILRRHSARKIVHIDGLAASIASIIAMAGDEIKIAVNGMMMIHNPWGVAIGESADFRKMADSLDKIRSALVDTYELRTHQDADQISAWMDEETWFTADEALENGFVDEVTVAIEAAAFAGMDLSAFRHVPADLKAAAQAEPTEPPADPVETEQTEVSGEVGKPHVAIAKAEAALRRRGLVPA